MTQRKDILKLAAMQDQLSVLFIVALALIFLMPRAFGKSRSD